MSEPYLGQIQAFGFNFAPRGWAFCNGQLLPIAQNSALFSLLGTFYGGDGRTTFALPDLRGRAALGFGSGPGLSSHPIGQRGGSEQASLDNPNQLPAHSHPIACSAAAQDDTNPTGRYPGMGDGDVYANAANAMAAFGPTGNTGGSQGHPNMQPFLAINFCIALQGTYPSRS